MRKQGNGSFRKGRKRTSRIFKEYEKRLKLRKGKSCCETAFKEYKKYKRKAF